MTSHQHEHTADADHEKHHPEHRLHHNHYAPHASQADNDPVSMTERNRSHWDQMAARYTSEQWQKNMINQITEFIIQNVNWIGVDFTDPSSAFEKDGKSSSQIRVLDYACGPGTVTNALGARATEYVGIDLSENMVKAYNSRFSPESGSENILANAIVGDLLAENGPPPSLEDPQYFGFDLVVVGLGFHHFEDVELAIRRLVDRLKSGGTFMILDFESHAPIEHAAAHTVTYHGFGGDEVRKLFGDAGLVDVDIVRMDGTVAMHGKEPRQPFMARGRKQ